MFLFPFRCPEGYTIRELKAEHAQFIAQRWPELNIWPNKITMLEECIQRFGSAAAFSDENDGQPVSWIMQYAYSEFGNLHTIDAHRRKGLGLAVVAELCRSVKQRSSITPFLGSVEGNSSIRLAKKLGLMCCKEMCCWIEINH